jgi:hypothetical protein
MELIATKPLKVLKGDYHYRRPPRRTRARAILIERQREWPWPPAWLKKNMSAAEPFGRLELDNPNQ